MSEPDEVERLLEEASAGDGRALERLMPLVYDELRTLAARMMRRERPDHTLQATALVHEAYLKMVDQTRVHWKGRAHFFALAAQAIRRILVDHARTHQRSKRGGGRAKITLDEELVPGRQEEVDLVALHEALETLASKHPQQARIVELRFFAGLTLDETAAVLDISRRTAARKWRFARACLYEMLTGGDTPS